MTDIRIHGILAKEFGDLIRMEIEKPRDVIRAVDCNRIGFRKRIIELQKQGFAYDIIVDHKRMDKDRFLSSRQPKTIDLVPVIIGSGFGPVSAAIAFAISLATVAISYALIDPGTIDGGEQVVSGSNESLIFQGGAANVSSQGSPIPIGYGRLLVGSQVVQSSVKSFPQSILSLDVMTNNPVVLPSDKNSIVETKSNKE